MTPRRLVPVAAAAAALALVPAAPAAAAETPLGGGTTSLTLDRTTERVLAANKVGLAPVAPARVRGGAIAFPISGGRVDLARARGHVDHRGGLRLTAGGRRLVVRDPVVRLQARPDLTVRVGLQRISLLALDLSRAKASRAGVDSVVSGIRASLTAGAARALNATFRVHLFRGGLRMGTVTLRATPKTLALSGRTTSLALSSGAASALQSLGVAASPLAPATAGSGGLAFSITGGRLDAKTLAGSITHSGGIRLAKGATQVDLTSFTIQVDRRPDLTALVGGARVAILDLGLSDARITRRGRDIRIAGVVAKLTGTAAGALNEAFGTTAFTAGLELGTATVAARVK